MKVTGWKGRAARTVSAWLSGVPRDKLLHFIAGLVVAALMAFAAPSLRWLPLAAAVAAGAAKEAADQVRYGGWDWLDLLATALGGAVIQAMALVFGGA